MGNKLEHFHSYQDRCEPLLPICEVPEVYSLSLQSAGQTEGISLHRTRQYTEVLGTCCLR